MSKGKNWAVLNEKPSCVPEAPGKAAVVRFRLLTGHDSTRGLLATNHVILSPGQVRWTTPELEPPSPNYHTTPHQREDVSALDRFNVHRCPTRRVFCGTGLELGTRQATIRYLYHSATVAAIEFKTDI
ncbi:uncharacterized protein TNCV_808391 [Trichonephila clavipes]|nr:uncharacterized protein TNCV_808391 [Trichonephila clavipes]